jgi:uncharacterized membrane protein
MLTGHYQAATSAMLLATLIPTLLFLPFQYLCSGRDRFPSQAVFYYLAYFLIELIDLLLGTGVKYIHLKIARRQKVKATDLFWVVSNRPDRILIGGFLFALLSLIPQIPAFIFADYTPAGLSDTEVLLIYGALSLTGSVLGFLLALPFFYIFWIYADDADCDALPAFRRSRNLLRGAKWRLCLLQLSFLGWMLLGIVTCGIGFLWILPYMTQSQTNFYLEQKHEFDVTVTFSEAAQAYM